MPHLHLNTLHHVTNFRMLSVTKALHQKVSGMFIGLPEVEGSCEFVQTHYYGHTHFFGLVQVLLQLGDVR
jgi:hypothetical protein